MPGPTNAADALVWIQEAITAGRYIVDAHFEKRARTRSFSVNDAKKIIATAISCAEYPTQRSWPAELRGGLPEPRSTERQRR